MMKLHNLLCLAALLLLSGSISRAGEAFNDDDTIDTFHPNWMRWVPDNVQLSQLSLPATHDTMARFGPSWDWITLSIYSDFVKTQSLPLFDQLLAGIRVIDVRGRHQDDRFTIYHGDIYQNATLEEVLDHYAAGGRSCASSQTADTCPHTDPLIAGFELTPEQKRQLIAFLQALTDPTFIHQAMDQAKTGHLIFPPN